MQVATLSNTVQDDNGSSYGMWLPRFGIYHGWVQYMLCHRHSTGIDNDPFVPQQTTGVIRGVPQACNVLKFPSTSIIGGQNWEGHWQGPALAGQVYW